MQPLRILLAEDNEDLREAMTALFETQEDMDCVASTGRLQDIESLATEHRPNAIVLDIELEGQSSVRELPRLVEALPGVVFIVYSGHDHPELIRGARVAGAAAYVIKTAGFEELAGAIRRTCQQPAAD